jgi:hypothetical protein
MPLEELLKLYGQNAPSVNHISQENDEVRCYSKKSLFSVWGILVKYFI